jgi:energy-coupling factor transporter ATP-binding protein EcfA2
MNRVAAFLRLSAFLLSFSVCQSFPLDPSMTAAVNNNIPLVVVFGRPGSGKSTIAEASLKLLRKDEQSFRCLGLDLDVAIPQWMKDNFSKGLYPTLQQRKEVALTFCDYVDNQCLEAQQQSLSGNQQMGALVSFSFVNTDLRDIFRSRFPSAVWVLVDTSEATAAARMRERAGHFYSGKPAELEDENSQASARNLQSEADNSDWNFAPVAFDHTILDGNDSVEINAERVSIIVREAIQKAQ